MSYDEELAQEMACWVAAPEKIEQLARREIQPCTCGHKGRTHSARNRDRERTGTGKGACGHCDCPQLTPKETP